LFGKLSLTVATPPQVPEYGARPEEGGAEGGGVESPVTGPLLGGGLGFIGVVLVEESFWQASSIPESRKTTKARRCRTFMGCRLLVGNSKHIEKPG
jgi:hypothetical protein